MELVLLGPKHEVVNGRPRVTSMVMGDEGGPVFARLSVTHPRTGAEASAEQVLRIVDSGGGCLYFPTVTFVGIEDLFRPYGPGCYRIALEVRRDRESARADAREEWGHEMTYMGPVAGTA